MTTLEQQRVDAILNSLPAMTDHLMSLCPAELEVVRALHTLHVEERTATRMEQRVQLQYRPFTSDAEMIAFADFFQDLGAESDEARHRRLMAEMDEEDAIYESRH